MATTSPDNIRTPNPADTYNLVPDLQTLAGDVQAALIARGNTRKGTASQRASFTSSAVAGEIWVDTDSLKMIWRRDPSVSGGWDPAVRRWSGTTVQMNSFTQAPNGFEWFSTSDNSYYLRVGGAWRGSGWTTFTPVSPWVVDATYPPAYKVSGGVAYFRGRVSGSTAASTIFTLPAGVRPGLLSFYILDRGSPALTSRVTVDTSGVLAHSSSSAGVVAGNGMSLNGIVFPTL